MYRYLYIHMYILLRNHRHVMGPPCYITRTIREPLALQTRTPLMRSYFFRALHAQRRYAMSDIRLRQRTHARREPSATPELKVLVAHTRLKNSLLLATGLITNAPLVCRAISGGPPAGADFSGGHSWCCPTIDSPAAIATGFPLLRASM
jgi:hypothetical protein